MFLAPKCPYRIPGWARIDGREYYLGTSNQTTWYEAEAMALEQGAVLLEVDSYQKSKIFDKIVDCKIIHFSRYLVFNPLSARFLICKSQESG